MRAALLLVKALDPALEDPVWVVLSLKDKSHRAQETPKTEHRCQLREELCTHPGEGQPGRRIRVLTSSRAASAGHSPPGRLSPGPRTADAATTITELSFI